jgi:ubiquinone biosynthesis protein UbiJ
MSAGIPALPDLLLAPLESLLNRNILGSTPAREMLPRLDGRVLALCLKDTPLAIYMRAGPEGVSLGFQSAELPCVVMRGGLLGMSRLAGGDDAEEILRSGLVQLDGDPELGRQFQELLQHARPDWEEELSRLLGDVAAHQIGNLARGLFSWGRQTGQTLQSNAAEFLQEESRDLVAPEEAREFMQQVDTLRDDVERAAAQLKRLESAAGQAAST